MSREPVAPKQMIAFKIGARARKFLIEGCPVEGYEVLATALAESAATDLELNAMLQTEMQKFERRLANAADEE
ncbi:MAG TPA: hypothetical protein VKT77_02580 [Chthonomonadaceae bacterium]|nr:hypothetical protein [Chthonomonadaceae bacterium]